MYGAIEAGGTKFSCAVGTSATDITDRITLPTRGPDETLADVLAFFGRHGPLTAVGVAAFGPVDIDPASAGYGTVLGTPKPGWAGVDYRARLAPLGCPVRIDTDVNGAGRGEHAHGAGAGCGTLAYVTVGTGIGVGILHDGTPIRGAGHYEMGHIRPPHDRVRDPFDGACPFHGDCLEGLAAGPAIKARWGRPLNALNEPEPAVDLIGGYLAHLCATLVFTHRPDRIILGGGVAKAGGLIDSVRRQTDELIARYVGTPPMDKLVVPPALGDRAGLTGALMLAASAGATAPSSRPS